MIVKKKQTGEKKRIVNFFYYLLELWRTVLILLSIFILFKKTNVSNVPFYTFKKCNKIYHYFSERL